MYSFFPLFSSSSLCSHIDRQSYKSLIFNKSKMQLTTAFRKCSESSHSSRSNKRQQRIGTLRSRAPVMKGGRSSNPRWERAQGPAWSSIWASWPAACRPRTFLRIELLTNQCSFCCTARVNPGERASCLRAHSDL